MPSFDKIVIVTKPTPLDELTQRFNTLGQARFYLEHMGESFAPYEEFDITYKQAIQILRKALPDGIRNQWIDRSFLPTFLFGPGDLVVTLGPDGLVVNTAKYLAGQPVLALNPDPERIDGVLLPFRVEDAADVFDRIAKGSTRLRNVTMAKATLNDGQVLHAVNDLFIGQRTHISARYRLCFAGREEDQSSSGIIVSTGAGSTGWLRSVVTGAARITSAFHPSRKAETAQDRQAFEWEAQRLTFSVREPFISKTSGAELVFGWITRKNPLEVISHMPKNGVIFSDGVEEDFLEFNSGAIARIGLSEKRLSLITPT